MNQMDQMDHMDQMRDVVSLIYGEFTIGTMIHCTEIQLVMMIIPKNPWKPQIIKKNISSSISSTWGVS